MTNANTSLTPSLSTSLSPTLLAKVELDVRPTLVQQDASIQFFTPSTLTAVYIDLLNLNGSAISSIHQGTINAGNTTFELPIPTSLSNGVYLIQVRTGGDRMVKKFILKK